MDISLNDFSCPVVFFDDEFNITASNKQFGNYLNKQKFLKINNYLRPNESDIFNFEETVLNGEFFEMDVELYFIDGEKKTLCRCLIKKVRDKQFSCVLIDQSKTESRKFMEQKIREKIYEHSFVEGYAESSIYLVHNFGNKLCSVLTSLEFLDEEEDFDAYKNEVEKVTKSIRFLSDLVLEHNKYANLKKGIISKFNLYNAIDNFVLHDYPFLVPERLRADIDQNLQVSLEMNAFNGLMKKVFKIMVDSMMKKESTDPLFKGEINIWAQKQNHSTLIMISDNGVGLKQEDIQGLFKPDHEEGSKYNLHDELNYIKSLGGSLQVNNNGDESGVTVLLSLKDEPKGQKLELIIEREEL